MVESGGDVIVIADLRSQAPGHAGVNSNRTELAKPLEPTPTEFRREGGPKFATCLRARTNNEAAQSLPSSLMSALGCSFLRFFSLLSHSFCSLRKASFNPR
jgi:hypothetical protein